MSMTKDLFWFTDLTDTSSGNQGKKLTGTDH